MSIQSFKPTVGKIVLALGLILVTYAIPVKVLVCDNADVPTCEIQTSHGLGFPTFLKPPSHRENAGYKIDIVNAIVNVVAFYGIACLVLRPKKPTTVASTANTAAK